MYSVSGQDILYSNFSPNIKDVTEAILVLLVIGDFLFQAIDESLCLGVSGMIFQKGFHCRLHRFIIILRPAGFGQDEMSIGLVTSLCHLMNLMFDGINLRKIVLNPFHVLWALIAEPATFRYGNKAARL